LIGKDNYLPWKFSIVSLRYPFCTSIISVPNRGQLFLEKHFANTPWTLENHLLICYNDHNNHQKRRMVDWTKFSKAMNYFFFIGVVTAAIWLLFMPWKVPIAAAISRMICLPWRLLQMLRFSAAYDYNRYCQRRKLCWNFYVWYMSICEQYAAIISAYVKELLLRKSVIASTSLSYRFVSVLLFCFWVVMSTAFRGLLSQKLMVAVVFVCCCCQGVFFIINVDVRISLCVSRLIL